MDLEKARHWSCLFDDFSRPLVAALRVAKAVKVPGTICADYWQT